MDCSIKCHVHVIIMLVNLSMHANAPSDTSGEHFMRKRLHGVFDAGGML